MRRWRPGIVLIFIILLSGCGVLSRIRQTKHHGLETHDFDLPVITYSSADSTSKKLLIFFSGDGGWLDFDDQLASGFAAEGFETIGLNTRTYFWTGRTPQSTADDVMQLISKYASLYKTNRIYLCGYSFGADVVPFIYNRLVPSMKNKVVAITLLSPFASSAFVIHTSDLLNIGGDDKPYKVQPEVEAIKIPVICFYGERENPKPLDGIQKRNFSLRLLPGDHHYDAAGYADILSAMQGLRRNLLFRPYRLRKL
ncbi:MAG: AcvB/VirJ family lysyl-phosphatidylglycerol hydrolase [Pedobacter sp.]|uniref:AcvB/VirJ family lysyl-phosphatidylglycerol hydrolase n=1 Tax=Pedobacter sp. TaxID=1411316 RepID=UPI003395AE77